MVLTSALASQIKRDGTSYDLLGLLDHADYESDICFFIRPSGVLLSNNRQKVGEVRSFVPKFTGPFQIKRLVNEANYEIVNLGTGVSSIVHYNRLVKFHGTHTTPRPIQNPIRPATTTRRPIFGLEASSVGRQIAFMRALDERIQQQQVEAQQQQ